MTTRITDPSIELIEIKKGKKNFPKFFHKLLKVDKEAFGDIGQAQIMKTFWNSRANRITICKKKDKGTILGYACSIPEKDGSCYLMRIAVALNCQRQGIGRLLVGKLLNESDGKMSLEVTKENEKAVSFY